MDSKNFEDLNISEFCSLTDLPFEVLEQILNCRDISHVDVCHIAQTCHQLNSIANSNELWRRKFLQTWKSLYKLFNEQDIDWRKECCSRHKYEKIVTDAIKRMRKLSSVSNEAQKYTLGELRKHFEGHRFASYFFTDALEHRIHDGNRNRNLTNKYYGLKILQFVRQEHLLRLLQQHIKEEDYNKIEIGAYLIAHFCQPSLSISQDSISNQLDGISMKVKAKLRESSPSHPVLCKDLIPSNVDLDETLWTTSEGLTILHAINEVLFDDLKFRCMAIHDLSADNIFINQVLETKVSTPIVLSIIYVAVAHRLGIRCVHTTADHGLLKCLETPGLDCTQSFVCVTVHKNGTINTVELDINDKEVFCSRLVENSPLFSVESMIENLEDYSTVLRRVENSYHLRFYETCALELRSYLNPNSAFRKIAYVEDLLGCETKLFDVLGLLEQFKQCEDSLEHMHTYERLHKRAKSQIDRILKDIHDPGFVQEKITPKDWFRKDYDMSYAVGMVMKSKMFKKICVIDGWEFRANRNRAVYHVFTENGKQGYVSEESLFICDPPRPLEHPDIGKYFEEFTGTHYIPNEAKSLEYPSDAIALATILPSLLPSKTVTSTKEASADVVLKVE